jgi:hypothetical protein
MTVQSEQIAHKDLVGGGQITLHSHAGGGAPPNWYGVFYSNYGDCDPAKSLLLQNMNGSAVTLAVARPTPTEIGTSVARCVQFTPPANMTLLRVKMFGIGTTTGKYSIAIYPVGQGSARLWFADMCNTVVNTWMIYLGYTPSVDLIAGTKYWFCITATGTGTTAGFRSLIAPSGTNFWGNNSASEPWLGRSLSFPVFAQFTSPSSGQFFDLPTLPAITAATYAGITAFTGGTTGSVPFAFLDSAI